MSTQRGCESPPADTHTHTTRSAMHADDPIHAVQRTKVVNVFSTMSARN